MCRRTLGHISRNVYLSQVNRTTFQVSSAQSRVPDYVDTRRESVDRQDRAMTDEIDPSYETPPAPTGDIQTIRNYHMNYIRIYHINNAFLQNVER